MNIKRQYILPNCSLILEGLEDSDTESVDILDGQSPNLLVKQLTL